MSFFATGLEASATPTRDQMLSLVEVQVSLMVRASSLRADSAYLAVDFAVGHPRFTVPDLQNALG